MQDIAFPQEAQTQKHLLGVCSDCLQVDANVSPKFLQDFAKIDAVSGQRLAYIFSHHFLP